MATDSLTPREGYKGRAPGKRAPDGTPAPESITPRYTGDQPSTYPKDRTPRQGFAAKLDKAGDSQRPDIPQPNVVQPIATRPTPRDEESRKAPK